MKAITLLLISTLLLAAKCTNTVEEPDKPKDVLFPLTIGNNWTYTNTWFDIHGDVIKHSQSTQTIEEEIEFEGEYYYRDNDYNYHKNDEEGYKMYYDYQDLSVIFFKYPVGIMEKFNKLSVWDENLGDTVRSWYELETDNANVTVPAGSFRCLKYVYRNDDPRNIDGHIFFYSLNVGLVKKIYYGKDVNETKFQEDIYELIGYNLVEDEKIN